MVTNHCAPSAISGSLMSNEHSAGSTPAIGETLVFARADFPQLIDNLATHGFEVIAPTVRDSSIVYDAIEKVEDLPIGWTDQQEAGRYRLERRGDNALFGYNVGPHSWKAWLYPSHVKLWQAQRDQQGMVFESETQAIPRYAFLGVRACELNAIAVQDKVLLEGQFSDAHYRVLREKVFIVAVNCVEAGRTCFCTSMNTGPKVEQGYDLALTELIDAERHEFLVEVGSAQGAGMLDSVAHRPAEPTDLTAAAARIGDAAQSMGRQLDAGRVKDLLQSNLQHPRWDEVAERCLSCGNCTSVCPTCFCTNVEDVTDLTGEYAERHRNWESCFSADFSYIHGIRVRADTRSRYRQWLTHKLANWVDQFDVSGCVGCGRCIAWCPVGIDITEEVAAIGADRD